MVNAGQEATALEVYRTSIAPRIESEAESWRTTTTSNSLVVGDELERVISMATVDLTRHETRRSKSKVRSYLRRCKEVITGHHNHHHQQQPHLETPDCGGASCSIIASSHEPVVQRQALCVDDEYRQHQLEGVLVVQELPVATTSASAVEENDPESSITGVIAITINDKEIASEVREEEEFDGEFPLTSKACGGGAQWEIKFAEVKLPPDYTLRYNWLRPSVHILY